MRSIFRPIPRRKHWNRQAPVLIKEARQALENGVGLSEIVRMLGISDQRAAEILGIRVFAAKDLQ